MPESAVRKCRGSWSWRRARWRGHVEAQPQSGLCVVDYCEKHDLRRESFYRWRRVFAAETAGAGSEEAVPSAGLFAEVVGLSQTGDTAVSGVELVLAGGRRVHLSPGLDADTLRRAVTVLESLPC